MRDRPGVTEINVQGDPSTLGYDDMTSISVNVTSAPITDASVTVSGIHFSHTWTVAQLKDKSFLLKVPGSTLDADTNTITVSVEGKDKNGGTVTGSATTTVTLTASAWERIELFIEHLFG